MAKLNKFALAQLSSLHLRDGNDALMYAEGPDGKNDMTRPMRVNLFGPSTKVHQNAKTQAGNRALDRLRKKGKSDLNTEDRIEETAKFLASCTDSFENLGYDNGLTDSQATGLTGQALAMAVYTDLDYIFIAQQIDAYLSATENFTKLATTN